MPTRIQHAHYYILFAVIVVMLNACVPPGDQLTVTTAATAVQKHTSTEIPSSPILVTESAPLASTAEKKSLAPPPSPTPEPEPVRFAVIGDFGEGNQGEEDVANLVKSWEPDFIITTGDNNYPVGSAETIDDHIGKYYHEFIYPYTALMEMGQI